MRVQLSQNLQGIDSKGPAGKKSLDADIGYVNDVICAYNLWTAPTFNHLHIYSEYQVQSKHWVNSCSMLVIHKMIRKSLCQLRAGSVRHLCMHKCMGTNVYGHTYICDWVCMCVNIYTETRRQPQVLILRHRAPCVLFCFVLFLLRVKKLIWSSPSKLGWQPVRYGD